MNIEDRLPVVEIIAPNGAKIRFYEQTSSEVIKELIDALTVEKKRVLAGIDEMSKYHLRIAWIRYKGH